MSITPKITAIFKEIISATIKVLCLCILIPLFLVLVSTDQFVTFLDNWQELLGSFLGAFAPLLLFFIAIKQEDKRKNKEHLLLLEKNIISAINNLSDIDRMLHRFVSVQLRQYKDKVLEDDRNGRYSVGQTFVPFSLTFTLDKDLIKNTTHSTYLENLILDIVMTSNELPIILQDIGRQFDRAIAFNIQVGLMRLTSTTQHNKTLFENISNFENFLSEQTFGVNIPVYLRKLVSSQIALQEMTTLGVKKWKRVFNYKYSPDATKKMEAYFKPKVDAQIEALRSSFSSKLLLVGEQPRLQP